MSDINEMNVGVRWYVVHTYSGYENKVMTNLVKIVENRGLGHLIFDVRVPVETVVEKKGDKEKEVENKIFPGYVLVKMIMTEESWHVVRNITGVTGFVGPGSRPTPLLDSEVEALGIDEKKVKLMLNVGDEVKVTRAPFSRSRKIRKRSLSLSREDGAIFPSSLTLKTSPRQTKSDSCESRGRKKNFLNSSATNHIWR